jgi:hypothetical protein
VILHPRPLRTAALGVCLVALVAPSVTHARPDETRVVRLGADNTFTASTTAGVRVRIPRPATFEPGVSSRDVVVEGAGRMAGYVLVEDHPDVIERVTSMTLWARFCSRPGCAEGEPFFWHAGSNVQHDPATGVRTLPAGDYFLYVIADDTEVTVRLRLHGLRGTRNVELTQPADAGIVLPRVRASLDATKSVYSFGEEVEFSGPGGIAVPLMRFRTGHAFSNRREVCYYSGGPQVPDPLAYGPQCPAADAGVAVNEFGHVEDDVVVDGYYSRASGPAVWGFGMNYVVTGEVREADSLFFHLDVDPAEL